MDETGMQGRPGRCRGWTRPVDKTAAAGTGGADHAPELWAEGCASPQGSRRQAAPRQRPRPRQTPRSLRPARLLQAPSTRPERGRLLPHTASGPVRSRREGASCASCQRTRRPARRVTPDLRDKSGCGEPILCWEKGDAQQGGNRGGATSPIRWSIASPAARVQASSAPRISTVVCCASSRA